MIGKTISHYKILEKLGGGGIGVVYKAQDTKLDRFVALKFLLPHPNQDEQNKQRFIHEAKAASALNHPNIATIYEIDDAEGQMFIAMEYIEGQSLQDALRKAEVTSPLSLDNALRYAIQLAEGLAKAHAKDIIHRDIKPANILVTKDGLVKIVDFGLAKLAGATRLTKEGTSMGTAAYMSPEQARGATVDHRTDIWALGAVIYELVSGKQPFAGDYEQAVIYSIMNEDPEPLTALRTGVPMELEHITNKCLAKQPDERYQSLTDLLVDLRQAQSESTWVSRGVPREQKASRELERKGALAWIAVSLLAVAVLVAAFLLFKPQSSSATSIAVLPFQNSTGDPENAFLCDGLAEGIINRLSLIPDFKVIARASSFQYRQQTHNLSEIGRALDVQSVLLGRLESRGDNLAISTELVDTKENRQLWGEKYLRPAAELVSIEEEIATSIAEHLQLHLSKTAQKRLEKTSTVNPQAYQLYMKGRYLTLGSGRNMDRALTFFREAVDIDPKFSLPYAGIAEVLTNQAWLSYTSRDEVLNEARLALRTALSLDSELSEAYKASAMIRFYFDWDWQGAEADFKKAIEFKPGNASAFEDYALLLFALERHEEALEMALQGQRLDPVSIGPTHSVGIAYMGLGAYEAAAAEFQKTIELHPSWVWGHTKLAMNKARDGYYKEALEAAARVEEMTSGWGSALLQSWLAYIYKLSGKPELVQRALNRTLEHVEREYVDPYAVATIYAAMEDYQNAFKWLEKAVDEKSPMTVYIRMFQIWFPPMAEDPRFKTLVERMKYPQ